MYRHMPKKMTMDLQRRAGLTSHKAFLYNTYINKTTPLITTKQVTKKMNPASIQKPVSASLSKMSMVGRIQGIKPGCSSCGK